VIISASDLAQAALAHIRDMQAYEAEQVIAGASENYTQYRESVGKMRSCAKMAEWFESVIRNDGQLPRG